MTSYHVNTRPDCKQILDIKNDWSLNMLEYVQHYEECVGEEFAKIVN